MLPPGEARRHPPPDRAASRGTPRPPQGLARVRERARMGGSKIRRPPGLRGSSTLPHAAGASGTWHSGEHCRIPHLPPLGIPPPYQGKQDPCSCRVSLAPPPPLSSTGHTAASGNRCPRRCSIFPMEKPVYLGSSGAAAAPCAELKTFTGSAQQPQRHRLPPAEQGSWGSPPAPIPFS